MHLRLTANRQPNVQRLANAGDVDGLARALEFRELVAGEGGAQYDLGVPVRLEALEALAARPGPESRSAIVAALADESVDVRFAALRLVDDYRDDQVLDALSRALGAAPVRPGRFDSPVYEALAEKLQGWRRESLQVLVSLDEPIALERATSSMIDRPDERPLDDEDLEALRLLAATPRAQEFVPELAERLTVLLQHDHATIVTRVEQVLATFGGSSVAPLVTALENPGMREPAIRALGRLKDKSVTSMISVYADDPDPDVRLAVMQALGEVRDPAGVRALFAGANDHVYYVRTAACAALDELGSAAMIVAVTSIIGPALERIEGTSEVTASGALALNAPADPFDAPELAPVNGSTHARQGASRDRDHNQRTGARTSRLSEIRHSLRELVRLSSSTNRPPRTDD
jgi:HEAT repeat protein